MTQKALTAAQQLGRANYHCVVILAQVISARSSNDAAFSRCDGAPGAGGEKGKKGFRPTYHYPTPDRT